nr:MAG TPA: hypothetical protein [Caudoviricetes sp.]
MFCLIVYHSFLVLCNICFVYVRIFHFLDQLNA